MWVRHRAITWRSRARLSGPFSRMSPTRTRMSSGVRAILSIRAWKKERLPWMSLTAMIRRPAGKVGWMTMARSMKAPPSQCCR